MTIEDDRQVFKTLWTTWKAGKGKPGTIPEKAKLLATAKKLAGEDVQDYCEASLRYLQSVRSDMLARVQADAGQIATDPVLLYRGIRGGLLATAFRTTPVPQTGVLISYSTRQSGGLTFASMGNDGNEDGLLYNCRVPGSEIVFFEDTAISDAYPDEYEVLVLHRAPATDVKVLKAEVSARAKLKFGNALRKGST